MTTVTGLTAERMLQIEAASVVDGDVVGNDLFLTKHDGSLINAGNVRGPVGPTGPMGHSLPVLSAQQILEIGQAGQIRAGRQLTVADFTNQGLSVPVALYNLSALIDASGNGRTLTNKGTVPFGVGINGAAASAAVFAGSTGQSLYIPDIGAADPFRIKTGSMGCWCRTAKRGVSQAMFGKWDDTVAGRRGWMLTTDGSANNCARFSMSMDGTLGNAAGVSTRTDIADEQWHFVVAMFDDTYLTIMCDGVIEATINFGSSGGTMFGTPAPFNIGSLNGDASVVATQPWYGRIDEVFVTRDVLSEEQARNLYCASVPHALGDVPTIIRSAVRKRRRGASLPASAFPSQPLRLHNFVNGVLTDEGSQNIPLASMGGGSFTGTGGPDGKADRSYNYQSPAAGGGLGSTDAGLPSGLNPRSYGCWVKLLNPSNVPAFMGWGGGGTSGAGCVLGATSGSLYCQGVADLISGPYIADGLWHFIAAVEDNAAEAGVKRKLYMDGEVVGSSAVMSSVALGGAGKFRVFQYPDGGSATTGLVGDVTSVWVHSGALTAEQIRTLYNFGTQTSGPNPKESSDNIEAIETARLLVAFDSGIEPCDLLDLVVMA